VKRASEPQGPDWFLSFALVRGFGFVRRVAVTPDGTPVSIRQFADGCIIRHVSPLVFSASCFYKTDPWTSREALSPQDLAFEIAFKQMSLSDMSPVETGTVRVAPPLDI
jgi:hypothetical protein